MDGRINLAALNGANRRDHLLTVQPWSRPLGIPQPSPCRASLEEMPGKSKKIKAQGMWRTLQRIGFSASDVEDGLTRDILQNKPGSWPNGMKLAEIPFLIDS